MAIEEYETRISKRKNKKLRKYEMIWPWSSSKVKSCEICNRTLVETSPAVIQAAAIAAPNIFFFVR